MFLNIGGSRGILKKNIIGIFDLDTSTVSKTTREYLSALEKKGELTHMGSDFPRSFVLYGDKRKNRVYTSSFTSAALHKNCDKTNGER